MRTTAALCLALAAAPALADDACDAPVQRWQPREAVLQHASSQGWQVQSLKIDDGCYEIRGRDAQGRAFKARLDPLTLRVLKMKRRDDDDNEHGHRGRAPNRDVPAPPPAPAPDANPALPHGTTPRGQIE